jgi:antitoxin component YwqK of YwqJK toxin-antitoxin module
MADEELPQTAIKNRQPSEQRAPAKKKVSRKAASKKRAKPAAKKAKSNRAPPRDGASRSSGNRANTIPESGVHKVYFTKGALSSLETYKNGMKHGQCKYYYRTGQLKAAGKMVKNQFEGQWTWWRENGQTLQEGKFENGPSRYVEAALR